MAALRRGSRRAALALLVFCVAAGAVPWQSAGAFPEGEGRPQVLSAPEEGGLLCTAGGATVRQTGIQSFQVYSNTDTDTEATFEYTYTGALDMPVQIFADGSAVECTVSCPEPAGCTDPDTVAPGADAWVYMFTDCRSESGDSMLAVEFKVDLQDTSVLSCGFSRFYADEDSGFVRCAMPVSETPADKAYIILLGNDLDAFDVFGYPNAMFSAEGDRESVSTGYTRYVSTADAMLKAAAGLYLGDTAQDAAAAIGGQVRPQVLDAQGRRLYTGRLEELFEAAAAGQRTMTLNFTLLLPARESVPVTIGAPED